MPTNGRKVHSFNVKIVKTVKDVKVVQTVKIVKVVQTVKVVKTVKVVETVKTVEIVKVVKPLKSLKCCINPPIGGQVCEIRRRRINLWMKDRREGIRPCTEVRCDK